MKNRKETKFALYSTELGKFISRGNSLNYEASETILEAHLHDYRSDAVNHKEWLEYCATKAFGSMKVDESQGKGLKIVEVEMTLTITENSPWQYL